MRTRTRFQSTVARVEVILSAGSSTAEVTFGPMLGFSLRVQAAKRGEPGLQEQNGARKPPEAGAKKRRRFSTGMEKAKPQIWGWQCQGKGCGDT